MVSPFPDAIDSPVGGVSGAVSKLVISLRALNNDLELAVVAPNFPSDSFKNKVDGFLVYGIKPWKIPGYFANLTTLRFGIISAIYDFKPDLVHYHGISVWVGCFNGPEILTMHGIPELDILFSKKPMKSFLSRIIGFFETRARKKFKNFIYISEYVNTYMPKYIDKIYIPNPIDDVYFQRHYQSTPQKKLIICGSIRRIKNILGGIEIFQKVKEFFYCLDIVGPVIENDYYDECKVKIKEFGLEQEVRFHGYLNSDKVAELFADSFALLMTSFQESTPLVISEAMAVGLPVVAYDVGGVGSMIKSGEDGFVVEHGNIDKFVLLLMHIYHNEETYISMRNCALNSSLKHKSDNVARETFSYYRKVIQRGA
ncbi:MAG: glycosyltransferase family 4 protein [Geobacteraceae bacterium]|nr:glycosyltransferase family 4 protein [Geobacteraceae bacterium]